MKSMTKDEWFLLGSGSGTYASGKLEVTPNDLIQV